MINIASIVAALMCATFSWANPVLKEDKSFGQITADAPKGSLNKDQKLSISVTQSQEVAEDFSAIFPAGQSDTVRIQGEIRISTGRSRPLKPIVMRLKLPTVVTASVFRKRSDPAVMVQFLYDGESETHDSFVQLDSKYDPASNSISVTVESKYFTNLRGPGGRFEAILVIAGQKK